jgi:hypothetical protein
MTTLFVDVSHHDWSRQGGQLDWPKVRAATSPVMIARATYGDPGGWFRPTRHFGDFQAAARAAGFSVCGGYHNLVGGDSTSIARQVDWLRRELDRHDCVWAMADVEPYPELVTAGMWPRREDVLRWHDLWYAVDDRVMAWYIPQWYWSPNRPGPNLAGMDLRALRGPLIQSHYVGGDGTACRSTRRRRDTGYRLGRRGGGAGRHQQYTSSGNVAGAFHRPVQLYAARSRSSPRSSWQLRLDRRRRSIVGRPARCIINRITYWRPQPGCPRRNPE